ncbi:MAG: hypothetical protein AAFS10_18310 [Myxococcota bacterium]
MSEAHDINDSWKVPLYLMSGVVLGVTLTALITMTLMGAFHAAQSSADKPTASISTTASGETP